MPVGGRLEVEADTVLAGRNRDRAKRIVGTVQRGRSPIHVARPARIPGVRQDHMVGLVAGDPGWLEWSRRNWILVSGVETLKEDNAAQVRLFEGGQNATSLGKCFGPVNHEGAGNASRFS